MAQYEYDEFGRRTGSKDPRNNQSWFVYDTGGRMLSATDALNSTTSYTYDAWNRKLSTTHPDGMAQTYKYTATGKLQRSTIPWDVDVETAGECAGGTNDGAACMSNATCPGSESPAEPTTARSACPTRCAPAVTALPHTAP